MAVITDLWSQQCAKGINTSLHPRKECIALINIAKSKEEKINRAEYVDRGKLTLNDGYNQMAQLEQIVSFYLNEKTGRASINVYLNVPEGQYQTPNIFNNDTSSISSQTESQPLSSSFGSQPPSVPAYRMSRGVQSLPELWREWHYGLAGGHSVTQLNSISNSWHKNDSTFYTRRSRIVKTIKKYAAGSGIEEETAMRIAEEARVRQKRTLDYLAKNYKKIFE